jgi:hypothetical protein
MIKFASGRIVQAGAIAAAALLAASVSAPSQAAPADQQANARPSQSASAERRICAMVELSSSRMPRRVCRTRAEWDAAGGLPASD